MPFYQNVFEQAWEITSIFSTQKTLDKGLKIWCGAKKWIIALKMSKKRSPAE
jgi:hypothetical protein